MHTRYDDKQILLATFLTCSQKSFEEGFCAWFSVSGFHCCCCIARQVWISWQDSPGWFKYILFQIAWFHALISSSSTTSMEHAWCSNWDKCYSPLFQYPNFLTKKDELYNKLMTNNYYCFFLDSYLNSYFIVVGGEYFPDIDSSIGRLRQR